MHRAGRRALGACFPSLWSEGLRPVGCALALSFSLEVVRSAVARAVRPVLVPWIAVGVVLVQWLTRSDATISDLAIGLTLTDLASAVIIAHLMLAEPGRFARVASWGPI